MPNESQYKIDNAGVVDNALIIDWSDNHQSHFHPIWLRHHCECELCGSSLDAVRAIRIHHIPEDISPAQVEHTADKVRVVWSNDQHESRLPGPLVARSLLCGKRTGETQTQANTVGRIHCRESADGRLYRGGGERFCALGYAAKSLRLRVLHNRQYARRRQGIASPGCVVRAAATHPLRHLQAGKKNHYPQCG